MVELIGIAGSLRRGSLNRSLLRAAVRLAPQGTTLDVGSIEQIPLYDGDRERDDGTPPAVRALQDSIAAADGLLIATPEYNASMPGVLKNVIDWLSRPAKDIPRVFGGKAVALIGATPGRGGTRLSQAAWLPVFHTLGLRVFSGGALYVAGATEVFDDQGELVDAKVEELLAKFLRGFATFAAAR